MSTDFNLVQTSTGLFAARTEEKKEEPAKRKRRSTLTRANTYSRLSTTGRTVRKTKAITSSTFGSSRSNSPATQQRRTFVRKKLKKAIKKAGTVGAMGSSRAKKQPTSSQPVFIQGGGRRKKKEDAESSQNESCSSLRNAKKLAKLPPPVFKPPTEKRTPPPEHKGPHTTSQNEVPHTQDDLVLTTHMRSNGSISPTPIVAIEELDLTDGKGAKGSGKRLSPTPIADMTTTQNSGDLPAIQAALVFEEQDIQPIEVVSTSQRVEDDPFERSISEMTDEFSSEVLDMMRQAIMEARGLSSPQDDQESNSGFQVTMVTASDDLESCDMEIVEPHTRMADRDRINVHTLNDLSSETRVEVRQFSEFLDLEELPLLQLLLTPEEISAIQFSEGIFDLDLSRSNVSDDQLIALIRLLPNLRRVNLFYCSSITDKGLMALSGLQHLEDLNLNSCTGLTSDGMLAAFTAASWPKLNSCDFSNTDICDRSLAVFPKFEALADLSICICKKITDEGILSISLMQGLRVLHLFGVRVSQEVLEKIGSAQNLRILMEEVEDDLDLGEIGLLDEEHVPAVFRPPAMQKRCVFLDEFLATQGIWEDVEDQLDKLVEPVTKYYSTCLESRDIVLTFDLDRDHWINADLALQHHDAILNMGKILRVNPNEEDGKGINWFDLGVARTPENLQAFVDLLIQKPEVFKKMRKLDLSGLELTFIPQILASANFPLLEELDLSGNRIRSLPPQFFCRAPQLRCVDLSFNGMVYLSPELLQFWASVEVLDFSHNLLSHFPAQFLQPCRELRVLDVCSNRLTEDSFCDEDWGYVHQPGVWKVVDLRDNDALFKMKVPRKSKVKVGKKRQLFKSLTFWK